MDVSPLPFVGLADGRVLNVGRFVEKAAEQVDAFSDVAIDETN